MALFGPRPQPAWVPDEEHRDTFFNAVVETPRAVFTDYIVR
jgi:hypothetical protein